MVTTVRTSKYVVKALWTYSCIFLFYLHIVSHIKHSTHGISQVSANPSVHLWQYNTSDSILDVLYVMWRSVGWCGAVAISWVGVVCCGEVSGGQIFISDQWTGQHLLNPDYYLCCQISSSSTVNHKCIQLYSTPAPFLTLSYVLPRLRSGYPSKSQPWRPRRGGG
jgi:hypothetical protein